MASAWAQLSKDEQKAFNDAYGGDYKAEYNDQHRAGNTPQTPASSSSSSSSSSTSSSPSNRVGAKETAQTVLNADNTSGSSDLFPDGTSRPTTSSSSSSGSQDRTETIAKERELATNEYNTAMGGDPLTTNFSDMSQEYKDTEIATHGSKENARKAHKEARRNAGTYQHQRFDNDKKTANYDVENLADFDLAAGGAGSGIGKEQLSRADLLGLESAGHSKQNLIDYAEGVSSGYDDNNQGYGPKAQNLLDSWKSELISNPPGGEDTLPGGGDTVPGGGDTVPGGGDTVPGGGDTVPGGGDTVPGGGDTVPGGGDTVPGGGDTVPGGGDTVPGGGDTVPGGGTIIENIQDVDVEQTNNQDFYNEQNNDITSTVTGDYNQTEIDQNNQITNSGGNQDNSSTVTQGSNQQAQDLLGGYIDDLTSSGETTAEVTDPEGNQEPGSSGFRRGQDLMNPNYFTNRQEVDSDQDNNQTFTNHQDNDIDSKIDGNNNFTQISQDNSIRNYGGDQRNFTYVSNSNNPYTETPASMATLAGYNSVSDSPGSTAAFVDQYQTMNRDAQKQYDGVGLANEMIYRANSVAPFNPDALDAAIQARPQLARDRATDNFFDVFGDIDNFPTFTWETAPPPERADEFDPDEAFDRYTDY